MDKIKWSIFPELFAIMLALLILLCISSCTMSETAVYDDETDRFQTVDTSYLIDSHTYTVCYDTRTSIVYLSCDSGDGASLTVMYNSDRLPMTIEEFRLQTETEAE